jgi:hypothetical protein
MPPSPYLLLEQYIAAAHRYVWKAYIESDRMSMAHHAEDLWQVAEELRRIQEDFLKYGRRSR